MKTVVFDASAVLALIKHEDGCKIVQKYLGMCIISAVNFTEVLTVMSRGGCNMKENIDMLMNTIPNIIPFNQEQACIAASFDIITKEYGLSLGDRVCLALAKYKNIPVLTADKILSKLDIGVEVVLIR